LSNSLALLSDAGHVITDVFAIGISIIAVHISRRPPDNLTSRSIITRKYM
jgi:cobalt-zinc-cadmium efflux system protein